MEMAIIIVEIVRENWMRSLNFPMVCGMDVYIERQLKIPLKVKNSDHRIGEVVTTKGLKLLM